MIRRAFVRVSAEHLFSVLLFGAVLAMAAGRGSTCWFVCLPGLLGGGVVFLAMCHGRGEALLAWSLVAFAVLIQCILGDSPGPLLLGVALGGGGLLGRLMRFGMRRTITRHLYSGRCMACMAGAAMAVVYSILYLNGGLWLRVGSFSVQLSETVKPLLAVFVAGVQTSALQVRQRYLALFGCGLMNVALLAGLSELGTAAVVWLAVVIVLLYYYPWQFGFFTLLVSVGAAFGGGAVALFVAEKNLPLPALLKRLVDKVSSRVTLFLHPDQADPLGAGYQQAKAVQALLTGGSLGTLQPEAVPVASSDYILVGVVAAMGTLFALLVIGLLWLLYQLFFKVGESLKNPAVQAFALTGWAVLVVSSLLPAAGSLGLCPVMGIAVPFLASGGTALLMSCSFLVVPLAEAKSVSAVYRGRRYPVSKGVYDGKNAVDFDRCGGSADLSVGGVPESADMANTVPTSGSGDSPASDRSAGVRSGDSGRPGGNRCGRKPQ